MGPLLCSIQVEAGAPLYNGRAVVDILLQHLLEGDGFGQAVHQYHVVDAIAALQSRVLVKLIEDHTGIEACLDLHHQADAVLVRLVPQVGYALQPATLDQLRHILD